MPDEALDLEENDRIVAELAEQWAEAPEPGSARVGQIESRGNDDVPMPIVQSKLSSAGYVYIWDRFSGDRSLTNRNMLPVQMKKRYTDGPHKGEQVFSRTDPALSPSWKPLKRRQLKCRLHMEDEERDTWDEMGFPVCSKSNLVSLFHVGRHMQRAHKDEYAAIQEMRERREQDEQREFQRMIMAQAAKSGVTLPTTRRTKNPNRVAAGKRVAAQLAGAVNV